MVLYYSIIVKNNNKTIDKQKCMVVSKEAKFIKCFTIDKTDQSHVNAVWRNFLNEILKAIYIKMHISGFNTIKSNMFDVKRQSEAVHCT